MKRLLLLRHAKSSWSDPRQADFERPLNPRGRKACERLGPFLAEQVRPPALVLCSPALRTRETWERIAQATGWDAPVRHERSLYAASTVALRDLLSNLGDAEGAASMLIVGHNPALQDLAVSLIGRGRADQIEKLTDKLPTGGLVEMEADFGAWANLTPGCARLLGFVTPRRLPAAKPGVADG